MILLDHCCFGCSPPPPPLGLAVAPDSNDTPNDTPGDDSMVHLAHEAGLTLTRDGTIPPLMPRDIANIAEIVHLAWQKAIFDDIA